MYITGSVHSLNTNAESVLHIILIRRPAFADQFVLNMPNGRHMGDPGGAFVFHRVVVVSMVFQAPLCACSDVVASVSGWPMSPLTLHDHHTIQSSLSMPDVPDAAGGHVNSASVATTLFVDVVGFPWNTDFGRPISMVSPFCQNARFPSPLTSDPSTRLVARLISCGPDVPAT